VAVMIPSKGRRRLYFRAFKSAASFKPFISPIRPISPISFPHLQKRILIKVNPSAPNP
jgi:hypothetical protein